MTDLLALIEDAIRPRRPGPIEQNPWSKDELVTLLEMRANRTPYKVMGRALNRSETAIGAKLARLKVPMANTSWTHTEIARMRELVGQGLTASQIGREIGKSRSAVCGMWKRQRDAGKMEARSRMPKREKTKQKGWKFPGFMQRQAPQDAAGRMEYKRKLNAGEIKGREAKTTREMEDTFTPPEMRKTLFDLSDDQGRSLKLCHWPYGEGPFTFCGRPASDTYPSYCAHHAMVHFLGPKEARRLHCEAA